LAENVEQRKLATNLQHKIAGKQIEKCNKWKV